MKTRIVAALIMLPLLIFIYLGGIWLAAMCFLLGLIGVWEFYHGCRTAGMKPCFPVAVGSLIFLYGIILFNGGANWLLLWAFLSVLASLLILFDMDGRQLGDAMSTLTGIFYVIFFSVHVVWIDRTGDPSILVWIVVLSAFGSDIMAYFTGMAMGKHKLCPKISPKKTVEGAIGGIIGSILVCGVFGWFFAQDYFIHCLILSVIGAVISQTGDLTASAFKRRMGIKDYGHLIPGHGGILDRFDSVLFTAPWVYYYIIMVI